MIDYESLTNENGHRVIAFGRYAGIVGAYNAIWTFGQRYNLFNIRRVKDCFDLEDLKTEYHKFRLPSIKIVVTGGGRVAKGALEVLYGMNIKKITPEHFCSKEYSEPVFTQLNSRDYNKPKNGGEFSRTDFYNNGENYHSEFGKFAENADILISAGFWDPSAPKLFTIEEMNRKNFGIKVIADITCDIDGSVPTTIRSTTIQDPLFGYDKLSGKEVGAFDEGAITIMAVDNLPCELPRDASANFGKDLMGRVLPHLIGSDADKIIERATIAKGGKLMPDFEYLRDYVEG